MNRKIKVAIVFGGKSAEHEVSLQSAKNVLDALSKDKYEPILIGIDKGGRWYLNDESRFLLDENNPKLIHLNKSDTEVALIQFNASNKLINPKTYKAIGEIDVAFPVIHGPYGEEGSIQGLFKLANIPYIGADILGSAVGMDKDIMKRLLRDAGMPIPKFLSFTKSSINKIYFNEVEKAIGCPMFIKPANLGSSVGICKVYSEEEFNDAVQTAFQYDKKIIIEEFIKGREIECSVLGNEDPIASLPGEIILQSEFYSYNAKYIDEHGATLDIPAKLPKSTTKKIQEYAIKSFKILCCQGMARVDFFLSENDEIIINELNTIPGFTKISMYPKLWEASGISYSELVDRLIELALARFKEEQKLKTSVEDES